VKSADDLQLLQHAEFLEYPTCVVGHAVTSERTAPAGTAIRAKGVSATITGRLLAPLDGRVLLHADGTPVAVLPGRPGGTAEWGG
jgi:hypothetical protein